MGDIDSELNLTDIEVGTSTIRGAEVESLILGFEKEDVVFPLSNGFDTSIFDTDSLADCRFYVTRKRKRDQNGDLLPGEELTPTGDEYISFGKPSGITFESRRSLVDAEAVTN